VERFHRQIIGSITSCEIVITDFVPAADRASLAEFVSLGFGKGMLLESWGKRCAGTGKYKDKPQSSPNPRPLARGESQKLLGPGDPRRCRFLVVIFTLSVHERMREL
jgi:hypothetical protein